MRALGSHTCVPSAHSTGNPGRTWSSAPAAASVQRDNHKCSSKRHARGVPCCTAPAVGPCSSHTSSSAPCSRKQLATAGWATEGCHTSWHDGHVHRLVGSTQLPRQQRRRQCSSLAAGPVADMEVPEAATFIQLPAVVSGAAKLRMPQVYTGAAATRGVKPQMEDARFFATLHPQLGVQRHTIAGGALDDDDTDTCCPPSSHSNVLNGSTCYNGSSNDSSGASSGCAANSSCCVASGASVSGSCFGTAAPPNVLMAGVLDGHAGAATAMYAARELPQLLHNLFKGRRLYTKREAGGRPCADETAAALACAFNSFDRWWDTARCDPTLTPYGWDESGATAVVSLLLGDVLVVGHSGDASALLLHGNRTLRLSQPHRPNSNRAEAERVVRAGGRLVVAGPGQPMRVVGTSAGNRTRGAMITRALGDFAFKFPQPLLLSQPDVTIQVLSEQDTLLVMTSDGVTDALSDEQVTAAALAGLHRARTSSNEGTVLAQAAAQAVVDAAFAGGSKDNITAVTMLYDWNY